MGESVYVLCALMSILCAGMLFKQYRQGPSHLLLWSCLCFIALAMNNIFLVVDMMVLPEVDIGGPLWRSVLGATAGSLLLFGLIWELT